MYTIAVDILHWVDNVQPGCVACRLVDAWGKSHLFIDKVSVFTTMSLSSDDLYPKNGIIACEVIQEWKLPDNRSIWTITTERPWGIISTTGKQEFDVLPSQLMPR